MHVSLYRKYRPDTFGKIVRQEHVVRVLKNQIAQKTVGHAYLFCGPRGTGKTSVARIFARAVNCERPQDGSPCGECAVCRALSGSSLDITEIDAASNNGVAEMRDLREKVQYPPTVGRYKVYIVDEVHMLTDSAFNALLKTLEEPPAHVLFILATTEPHKIPATILSRCMRLDFKLIPEADLRAHLKGILEESKISYEEEAVAAIARAGAGSDRDMLSLAEMCIAYSEKLTYESVTAALGAADFSTNVALARALLSCDVSESLALVERALAEGKAVGVLLRDILELLRQISLAKACRDAEKLLALPAEMYLAVKELADGAEGRAILRATEIFAKTENELRFSSSPRVALETAVVRTAVPQSEYDIDALLLRVSRLEERLEALGNAPADFAPPAQSVQSAPPVQAERFAPPEEPPEEPAGAFEALAEEYLPPEEPVFGESEPPVPPQPPQGSAAQTESSAPPPSENLTAEQAYGRFMKQLRKSSKNGVLFTMCSDLTAEYEGEKLVLFAESETVFRALGREAHRAVMAETFSEIGVGDFEVRFLQAKPPVKEGLEQLKRDFSGYPIEIK